MSRARITTTIPSTTMVHVPVLVFALASMLLPSASCYNSNIIFPYHNYFTQLRENRQQRAPSCIASPTVVTRTAAVLSHPKPSSTRVLLRSTTTTAAATTTTPTTTPASTTRYSWYERYQQLAEFYQKHHHCRVPKQTDLGKWVRRQKQKKMYLSEYQVDLLNQVGLSLLFNGDNIMDSSSKSNTDQWWKRLDELQSFMNEHQLRSVHEIHKDSSSTNHHNDHSRATASSSLLTWIRRQRQKMDALPKCQMEALDTIDPDWKLSRHDYEWMQNYQAYVVASSSTTHSTTITTTNSVLYHWIQNQRKKRDSMPDWRRKKLNEVGFVWNHWEQVFFSK